MKMRDPSYNMGTSSTQKYVLTGITGRYLGTGDAFVTTWSYDPSKVKLKNIILDYRNSPGGKQNQVWETGGYESPGWLMDGYRTGYQSSTPIYFEDCYALDYNGRYLVLWTGGNNWHYNANRGPYQDGNTYVIGGTADNSSGTGNVNGKGTLTGGVGKDDSAVGT